MAADGITSDEAAAVFRRAAELDLRNTTGERTSFDLGALEQAGLEAGLSRESIRQAIAEVRAANTLELAPHASASRTVNLPADKVEYWIKDYMRSQGFRVMRDLGDRAVWAPDRSWAAAARRAFDFNRRIVLREITRVVTTVVPIPNDSHRSHVRFELDLGRVRWAWRSLPMAAVGIGAGTAITLALVGIEPGAIAAGGGGALLTGGAYLGARAGYRGSRNRSVTAVELFLDRLEQKR